MALNSYYRSEPDQLWDRFKEQDKGHAEFYDDVRDYLLEEHSSNFTQFIQQCSSPYDTVDFWSDLAESGRDPKRIVDDVFQDVQAERQQHYIEDVVIAGGNLHPIVPFKEYP